MLPTAENIFTEFKRSFNDDVIETLVAFAFAKGVSVYVGVTDTEVVNGVTVGKKLLKAG